MNATCHNKDNPLADQLFAAALLAAPGLSLFAAETFIPIVVSSFLAMTGQFDIENMDIKCLPSRSTLRSMLIECAVDCLLLLSDKVAGKKFHDL